MKFILDNWSLILLALVSGAMLLWPMLKSGSVAALSANAVVQMINREKAVVVDVSDPEEYAQAHIANARNVPLKELETRLPDVVKNKALPVIFVCRAGSRSGPALKIAQRLGFEKAYALDAGMKGWTQANLPVQKS